VSKLPAAAAGRLTDGRQPGDFSSRYPREAWFQIGVELVWLVSLLVFCLYQLLSASIEASTAGKVTFRPIGSLDSQNNREILLWCALFTAGVSGGASFSLKWLYHSVAKNTWNRDRIVWRLIVPLLSGVLATFLGFMIVSGLIPLLSRTAFDTFFVALGFGYFVGYFSDNALASLHGLADKMFGTLEGRRARNAQEHHNGRDKATQEPPPT
jgi:hypothetical protein